MARDGVTTAERRVEFFSRASVPRVVRDRPSSIVERLDRLDSEGRVGSVETHTWPEELCPVEGAVADRYEEFDAWADANGVALDPFFETRECRCLASDRSDTALVLPVLCLAVYEGGDLRAVYPHATGDGVRTVDDGIAALATRTDGDARQVASAGD